MSIRATIGLTVVAALLGAGLAYYLAPPRIKTVETTKEVIKKDIQTIIRTVKQPNGVEETTTTIVDRTVSKEKSSRTESAPAPRKNLNVSALVTNDFSDGEFKPVYGVSVSKEVLGPITIGAFGLTNGTIGLSVGVNF